MMKQFLSITATALSLGFLSQSCEKKADFGDENKYTQKLVVNCLFNADSSFRVDLSKSHYVLDNASTFIEDARVDIYEEGLFVASLNYYDNINGTHPFYQSINIPRVAGKEYTLQVFKEGFNTITAKSKFPHPPDLGQTELLNKEVINGTRFKGDLSVELNDPMGEQNYYHVVVRRANWEDPTNMAADPDFYAREHFTLEDFPGAIEGYDEGFLFSDDGFNGQLKKVTCVLNTNYNPDRADDDHFILEVRNVTRDYYEYSRSVYEQKHAPYNKFVTIHSNVEGGLGIFAGYNSISTKVEL